MLSLSDNEFAVIGFLTRNFSERLTIRTIAKRLSFSAAGVFNSLKKLEKEKIVYGERLGTGLFYSINFEGRIGEHLAAISLLYSEEKIDARIIEYSKRFKAAMLDKKTLLVISDSLTSVDAIDGYNVITRTEDELLSLLRKKDQETMQILKKGAAIWNEMKFVELIKNSVLRF